MGDKIPGVIYGSGNTISISMWGVIAFGIGCAYLVRLGYEFGVAQSKKVLKQHEKGIKAMKKQEKIFFKEQAKEKRMRKEESK